MNKDRFIERLNLYLDKELSAEDSEELIGAIRQNPEYHRIYLQYRRMFSACAELGPDFSVAQRESRAWKQKMYAIGGFAAAFALLAMAAQNLSPLINQQISGGSEPALSVAADPVSTNDDGALELLVVDMAKSDVQDAELESLAQSLGTQFQSPFAAPNFNLGTSIEFARFGDTRDDFAFGRPVQASTFEHEQMSAHNGTFQGFSIQAAATALPAFGVQGDAQPGFTLERAASIQEKPAAVPANVERSTPVR